MLDTDNDGIPNAIDPNPADSSNILADNDGDGVPNIVEVSQGTNPNDGDDFQDSDGDKIPDYVE